MEATPQPAAAAPQPVPPVQQQPFVQPQPYIPPETMADGGAVAKPKWDYVELGFMIFGVAGICFVIYYYVQKSKQSKKMAANLPAVTNRVAEIEKKITIIGKRLGIAA